MSFSGTGWPSVNYIRSDEFLIVCAVQNVPFPTYPTWQSKEGGTLESDSVVTHPGGMLGAVALGGPVTRSDCTVKRMYSQDMHPYMPALEAACGNARAYVSWTPLDSNANPTGDTYTITGILKSVTAPSTDANTSAAALLELVISCDQ